MDVSRRGYVEIAGPLVGESRKLPLTLLIVLRTVLLGRVSASACSRSSSATPATWRIPSGLSWTDAQLVSGDAAEAVGAMKREGDSPMGTLGSLILCRSLLKTGLVDHFGVVVFSVLTGSNS